MRKSVEKDIAVIEEISEKLDLPNKVRDEGIKLFTTASDKMMRGRPAIALAASCLYAACRIGELPVALWEISRVTPCSMRVVARNYRLLIKTLEIKIPISDPLIWLPRCAEKLKVSRKTEVQSKELIEKVKRLMPGRTEEVLAAVALYWSSLLTRDQRITQREIAEVAMVTEATVRNYSREMGRLLRVTMPDLKDLMLQIDRERLEMAASRERGTIQRLLQVNKELGGRIEIHKSKLKRLEREIHEIEEAAS